MVEYLRLLSPESLSHLVANWSKEDTLILLVVLLALALAWRLLFGRR